MTNDTYTVMTVCTGNICRSPMGEIILRHFFNERGLGDRVNVESSGVSDEEWSHPIDPRAVHVLRQRGYGDEIPRDHFAHRISRDEICLRRRPGMKARSIWSTPGMAASMNSRSPSIRSSMSHHISSTGWDSSCKADGAYRLRCMPQ